MSLLQKIEELSRQMVRGCTKVTPSGVTLFTPDGVASYDALWLRDFSYMVEYAPETVEAEEIIGCVNFAIGGRREDGWMPDRIYADGLAVYAAGEVGKPVGEANLDNTPFLVYIVSDLMKKIDHAQGRKFFAQWYDALAQGLLVIPTDADGLVYSDPARPHSPYGFTDTVAKTGSLMMESLLLWRACRKMEAMCAEFGKADDRWRVMAEKIEAHIGRLYDAESGMFLAADHDCRQIDIWGNTYMLYIGFPAGAARETILHYLKEHVDEYVFAGQIRHLPKGQYWERLLIDVPHETYQNGAYWATATGWLAWCLYQADPALGLKVLTEAGDYLLNKGSFECVNAGYQKLPSFVVSATNVLGGMRRLAQESLEARTALEK